MADNRNLYLDIYLPQREQLWGKAWELAQQEASNVAAKQQIRLAMLKELDKEIFERQKLVQDFKAEQANAKSARELEAIKVDQGQRKVEYQETNANRRANASNAARIEAARQTGNAQSVKDVLESLHAEREANLREAVKSQDVLAANQGGQGRTEALQERAAKLVANPLDSQAQSDWLGTVEQTIEGYANEKGAYPVELIAQSISTIPNDSVRQKLEDYVRARLPDDAIARWEDNANLVEFNKLTSGQRKGMLVEEYDLTDPKWGLGGGSVGMSVRKGAPVGPAGEMSDEPTAAGDRIRAIQGGEYKDDQLDKLIAQRAGLVRSLGAEPDIEVLPRAREIFKNQFSGTQGVLPDMSFIRNANPKIGTHIDQPPPEDKAAQLGPAQDIVEPPAASETKVASAPKADTPSAVHARGIIDAIKSGNTLAATPNRMNRLLANDPLAQTVSRSYSIDTSNEIPLDTQMSKLLSTYAGDPQKQSRAVSMLFAIHNKSTNDKMLSKGVA